MPPHVAESSYESFGELILPPQSPFIYTAQQGFHALRRFPVVQRTRAGAVVRTAAAIASRRMPASTGLQQLRVCL